MRGFVRTVIGTVATIIALALSYAFTPIVSQWIQDHTKLDETIDAKIYSIVEQKVGNTISSAVDSTVKATKDQIDQAMKQNPGKQDQISFIRDLGIPDFLEEYLLKNNNADGYKDLGVSDVYHFISRSLTVVVVNVIAGIATFVLLRLILLIICLVLGSVIKAIPVIRVVDKLGGIVAGVALGVIIVWLLMFTMSLILKDGSYDRMIKENKMLEWLDSLNVIKKLSIR